MIDISRRVVLAVLVWCVASSLAADSYHPDLIQSQVVTLDARTIEAYANSGKPFTLDLGDVEMEVTLAPAPVWPDEGLIAIEVAADGSTKEGLVKGNLTYAGEITGEDPATTEVRLTIVRGVLQGYVMTSTDWWFVEPLSRFDPKAGFDEYLVYAARDFGAEVYPGGAVKADRVVDYTRIFQSLLWVADKEYFDQTPAGMEWFEVQAVLLNDVNGIFQAQTGRVFRSRRSVADAGGVFLTATDPGQLLVQLELLIANNGGLADHFESDIAHLTVGKNLDRGELSAHWRRDRYGLSRQRPGLWLPNVVMAARAIGGNYNAGAEQALQWCGVQNPCVLFQTIMHPVFNSNTTRRFSDGTIDPAKNNVALICAEMGLRGFPCILP